ncbi:class I SAM-dependent methyltransferase [Nocardioides taihuensis]|uniref:Class I SAM-dependent methyltransferase n=1 Tax=Nocardioides taihuensis TaxID=1835606 RepID=A0ABW0BM79_9ACTN
MSAATPQEQVHQWAGMFDTLSASYDQSGVPFFTTIAQGLVERLAPRPGERAADLGAGRGAATFPLAEAVGPEGRVDALDVAPGMVRLTSEAVAARGLDHVRVLHGDASDPSLPPASYDVVASSLVLFFLPQPEDALPRWLDLLDEGGRLGVATFRPWSGTWKAIEDLFAEYDHDTGRPATTSMPDVYATDEGVEGLLRDAGAADVRTDALRVAVPFDDVEQWRVWSLGTAMRGLWMRAPEEKHEEILARVADLLDADRGPDGRSRLHVDIRYTLGRRA